MDNPMTDPAPKPPEFDFALEFAESEQGSGGWFSYYSLLTDGGVPSDILIRDDRRNRDENCTEALAKEVVRRWNQAAKAVDEEAIRRDEMERCCGMLIDLFGPDSTAEAYIRGRDRKGGG